MIVYGLNCMRWPQDKQNFDVCETKFELFKISFLSLNLLALII